MTRSARSAGLLLFRQGPAGLQVLLAHPGGPFWARRDAGAWTIPKGEIGSGEDPLAAACREFEEETGFRPHGPFLPLGEVRQKAGKTVLAWAWEGDLDASRARSHTFVIEWRPRSGRRMEVPEADRCEWFGVAAAREKLNAAQVALLDRLEALLRDARP